MIKAIIFDLDDTLISEYDYIQSGFHVISNHLSKTFHIDELMIYDKLIELFHENSQNIFNRVLDFYAVSYLEETIEKLVYMYRNHNPKINLYDDVIDVLNTLRKKGIKIGIITDGYKVTQHKKIRATNLEKYVDYIIVTDELGREFWKPHPKAYAMMKEHFNLQYDEMMYVGDNLKKDFVSPINLGMKWVHISRNKGIYSRKTANSINTLKELKIG